MGEQRNKYDWVLFDADNTLFDFSIASKMSFRDLIVSLGIDYTSELYDIYHMVNLEVWHLFEQNKIDAQELRLKRFADFFDRMGYVVDPRESNAFYLSKLVEHSSIYDTTMEMLDQLNGSYKMAIITNGLKEVQRPRITKLNLDKYFQAIIVSDEIGHSKPNKAYFDHVFNEIEQPARDRVLVVGDSLRSDIHGGNLYGLDTCWYNAHCNPNITDIKPTFEINSHPQLFSYL